MSHIHLSGRCNECRCRVEVQFHVRYKRDWENSSVHVVDLGEACKMHQDLVEKRLKEMWHIRDDERFYPNTYIIDRYYVQYVSSGPGNDRLKQFKSHE
jgi:hypothetical protein